MKKLLIALGLTAALATPAHAYYLRDCLRGAPCPGFNVPSPRSYAPAPSVRRDDMVRHQPTTTMIRPWAYRSPHGSSRCA